MSLQSFIEDLKQPLIKDDIDLVCETILANSHFIQPKHPRCFLDVKCSLDLPNECNCDNMKIIRLIEDYPKFLKRKDNIDVRKYFLRAIFTGYPETALLFLKLGKILKNVSDTQQLEQEVIRDIHNEFQGKSIVCHFLFFVQQRDQNVVDIVKIFFKCGVNKIIDAALSPLHYAVITKNMSVIKFFLEQGFEVNIKSHGAAPLFFAVLFKNFEIANLLLSHGADIYTKYSGGYTTLHGACSIQNDEMMKLFINKGATISVRDDFNRTPFSFLNPEGDNYDKCAKIMVKEFSKLTYENKALDEIDIELVKRCPKARVHFESCMSELNKLSTLKFFATHSFYSIINSTLSIKKLANYLKNNELALKLENTLQQSSYFKEDLEIVQRKAVQQRDTWLTTELRLFSTLGNFLPDIIVKKLAKNLTLDDLPEH